MAPLRWLWRLYLAIFLTGRGVAAIEVNENDPASVKSAAASVAADMMDMYEENIDKTGIIGKLDGTWWVGGAMFMTMIQYWYLTGDSTYNSDVTDGMLAQKGEYNNYFPSNWSTWLGNDDQVFWGLAAMTAAELNYPQRDGEPSWVALAQGVFNNQVPRWDDTACGGGMRWQCFPYQEGYTLKNAVSNGGLFHLASRLYYYTSNRTYYEWANKIWDWSAEVPLINEATWVIADSTNNENNCSRAGNAQWTYNYGMYLSGAAYMYNSSDGREEIWLTRVNGLLGTVYREFFPKKYDNGNIMSEYYCEIPNNCDGNSSCFKAFLSTWMAFMTTIVQGLTDQIMPKLKASATGAAAQCSGGSDGKICGMHWYETKWDGNEGICEQMSALGVLSASLIDQKVGASPKTIKTGGTSKPDPNAGTGGSSTGSPAEPREITTGDRAGAGIVTAVFVLAWVGGVTWMLYDK